MARSFDGSNDGLTFAGAPTTSTTLTMGGWFFFNSGLASTVIMSLGTNGSTSNRRYLRYQTSDGNFAAASVNNGGTTSASSFSAAGLFDTWLLIVGVWTGTTSRQVYVAGTPGVANNVSNAPNAPDQLRVAISHTGAGPLAGRGAELGMWDLGLTDDDIVVWARGLSPLCIRPEGLVGYWPLVGRTSPEVDLVGGNGLSLVDAPAVADHPKLYQRRSRAAMIKTAVSAVPKRYLLVRN